MSRKLDAIKQAALVGRANARALLEEVLPGGKVKGSEYVACNILRGDAKPSLSINLNTGKGNDLASPDYHYGDLVALCADLWGMNQYQAACGILERFGYAEPGSGGTPSEAQQRRLKAMQDKARRNQEREERLKRDREDYVRRVIAPRLWHDAEPESGHTQNPHPYLIKKQVEAHNTRRLRSRNLPGYDLLIPICDQGALLNLQIINPHGQKRFIRGGRVSGCYCPMGRVSSTGTLYICEGWATGATLQEYYGEAVACAMFARNLEPVARKLRDYYGPDQHIVIAGDDDRGNRYNAGRTSAEAAAEAIGADLIFPDFSENAPKGLSDFNDLHLFNLERVEVTHG